MFIPVPIYPTNPNIVSIVKKSSAFAFRLIIAIQFECFFFVLYMKTSRSFHFDFLSVAPQPPQRDPQTSLSVGKAQGKQYAEGMAELGMYIYKYGDIERDYKECRILIETSAINWKPFSVLPI